MDVQAKETTNTIIPREYQIELLKDVKKKNTILYLPTGSGKTYIATMLIKEMGECLNKPTGKGRKWTFFIVQSVPLVSQQAKSLRKHLPWNIGTFSGDMNVDLWSQDQWNIILEKCHIMVMTAQIYLNNLIHGYMNMKDANLIIFDECHHAVQLHPYRQIMLHPVSSIKDNERPHILGLTATLINSNVKNVKEELTKLQETFGAVIRTRYDEDIGIFSARPQESMILYDEYILDEILKAITNNIKVFNDLLRNSMFSSLEKTEKIVENKEIYHLESNKLPLKDFANYFLDIEANLIDSGVYIAYLTTWHYIIEVERKKKVCKEALKLALLSAILSEIIIIRKMLYDYMKRNSKNIESALCLFNNASPKLNKLMKILSNLKRTDICLVFVDRRTTAKMLYHYIQDYIRENKVENIKCDFIVGARGMFGTEYKEAMFKKQKNNEIIKKFNENLINVLITSEVLEEGIDIQTCNYVIRYDTPKNFPSYVQSKGRARSVGSKFIILVPNREKFEKVISEYVKMEGEIDKILVHNEIDDDDDYNEVNVDEVFKTKFATCTYELAISIINRYCFSLPQDHFTVLSPEWYIAENNYNFKKYKLKLPINSAINTPINGENFKSKKNAKKSAAFNTCKELYKVGALDDYLLPVNIKNKPIYNEIKWFPHWNEKDSEAEKCKRKPGTNKMKRMVHIESPSYIHGAYPQVGKPSYLHILHCVPKYSHLKDTKYETFDKLLKSTNEFGILTSKKLPKVSRFPIFLHFGDVNVDIQVNVDTICLDYENLKKLDNFHNKLFLDVLGVKDFVIRCYNNKDYSYLIVPVYSSDNSYNIDWNVVDISTLVETCAPTMEQRKSKFYEEHVTTLGVISPWYRNITPIQKYIVTDIFSDMTPASVFPTADYDTYETYFSDKYGIYVADKNQPMIKVKSLGVSKINYLIPRISCGKIDKRTEYTEILIPEFCMWHKFPSVYWLKALMLPTILYRLNKLLLAQDLLEKINSICNIQFENNLSAGTVEIDNFCGSNEVKKKNIILPICDALKYTDNSGHGIIDNEWNSNNLPIDIERQKNTTMLDILNYHTCMYNTLNPNENHKQDILNIHPANELINSKNQDFNEHETDYETDYKRCKYATYSMEYLEEINKLMKNSMSSSNLEQKLKRIGIFNDNLTSIKTEDILSNVLTELNVLNFTNESPILSPLCKKLSKQKVGPKQSDIIKVITPPIANDMFNYERLETYGDSFLKFATSLVLFDAFESENEGVLTALKMKIVGNRNLFYVGQSLNIGSYLLVNTFEPTMDWIPPCFSVPKQIIEIINYDGMQSDVLHQIFIPRDDKYSGKLSDKTWIDIENEIIDFKKLSNMPMPDDEDDICEPKLGHSQSDIFINKQSVSDKMVADCVESLIGSYVYNCGVEVGFKILTGLGIIPKEFIDAYKPKPVISDNSLFNSLNLSNVLPGYEILEQRIGYSFKNKELLVQALTHPSYQFGFTECYQRIEFLGDAILDFLITTYIIEHCNNKTPGEITDIRSSLVNNITFASLSTRIGLHRFILAKSVKMTEAIDRFFEHQQKNNHKIGQEVLYLIEERDCYAAESVDVPKVLGDMFESLIGAIYLDCNRDLNFVWKICYKFLENEISEFCANVPKNPIRILHETNLQPHFSKPSASVQASNLGLGTMIQLDVTLNKKNMTIFGFGQNKKEAKVAAAKMALKNMKKMVFES